MTAHILDLELQLVLRPSFRALQKIDPDERAFLATNESIGQSLPHLEGQVLQEVGGPIRLIGLGPAAGIDENTDGRRLHVRRVLGRNLPDPHGSASYPSSHPKKQQAVGKKHPQ